MIIDTSQGNIEVIGDVKEFKTSIDPKNLEFITTLLSSNLYSNPEQSFIREIVSNAWDSHVEAGTTDIPVIIKFGDDSSKYITIRDYGTGLSPERVKEIYCNIGSSTKRDSNDFIGGFGIGKYSALACTNTVYITSYYEGKAYYYMMIKSGNSITTNLLMEKPTNEKNGVEVTIKNITSFSKYIDALKYIVFFPNIYIDGVSFGNVINQAKLKKFDNFAASSVVIESKALLGNVLYPIDKSYFKGVARDFLSDITYTGIVIKFNVGELNITPNRENIIYTSDTINKIEKRILSAKKEIDALVSLVIKRDFDDILEYTDYLRSDLYYNPIDNVISNRMGYIVNIKSFDIKYKGINLVSYVYSIRNILDSTLPTFKGLIYDDKIITRRYNYYTASYRMSSRNIIMLDKGVKLSPVLKSFLKDNYDNYGIMTYITKEDFVKLYDYFDNCSYKDFILSGCYESMMKRATRLNVDTDPDFLKYKADNSKKGYNVKEDKEVILHVIDWRREKHKFNNFSEAVDFIKNKHKGIMLTTMETDDNIVGTIAQLKDYICIKARKDVVADIRALNLKCLVDVDWLMNKDPMLSIVKTLQAFFPVGTHYTTIEALKEINYELYKLYERFEYFHKHYGNNYTYKCLANRDSIPIDDYTKKFCEDMRNFVDEYTKAKNEVRESIGAESDVLATALLMKTKAYRVSYEAYSKVKNNKILNVLCRK